MRSGRLVLDNVRVATDSDEQFLLRVGVSLLTARRFFDSGHPVHIAPQKSCDVKHAMRVADRWIVSAS